MSMPHASHELRQLIVLCGRLQRALEADDWTRVGELDSETRSLLCDIDALHADGLTPSPELLAARRRLASIHAEAMERCRAECARLRDVLARHVAQADGWAAYRQLDGMTGE